MLLSPNRKSNKSVCFDADLSDKDHPMPYSGQFEIQCADMEDNRYCQLIDIELTPVPDPYNSFANMILEVKQVSAPKWIKHEIIKTIMKEKDYA